VQLNCEQVYGRLTVVSIAGAVAHCMCECGTPWVGRLYSLKTGNTRSCGCLQRDHAVRIGSTSNKSHGMTKTSEYQTWLGLRKRCNDPTDKAFANYGGRGISVCAEWASFEQFFADMGPRPRGMSIERRENDGPYSKANCVWATPIEQTRNRRNTINVTLGGETYPLIEVCKSRGAGYPMVHSRLFKYGWSIEEALATPKFQRRPA